MRVNRIDRSTLAPAKRLDDGSLLVEGKMSRVGTQVYYNADGSQRVELRLEEHVFDQAAIDSFKLAPLTNDHPQGRVTPDNYKKHVVGTVGENLRRDGDYLVGPIRVIDAQTIRDVESGKVQLSCGYSCEVDSTPGEHPVYGKYDAIQKNLAGNHLAIVSAGRAGPEARMRLDASGDAVFCTDETRTVSSPKETKTMYKLKVGNHTYEVADANIQATVDEAIGTEKSRADAAQARAESAEKKLSALEAERDQLAARVDAEQETKCDECRSTGKVDGDKSCPHCDGKGVVSKKMDTFERRLQSRERSITRGARGRADLMGTAAKFGLNMKFDDKSDLEIKRQVARKHYARSAAVLARLDGDKRTDEAYIEALFETAVASLAETPSPPRLRAVKDEDDHEDAQNQDEEDPRAALQRQRQRRLDAEAKKKGGV